MSTRALYTFKEKDKDRKGFNVYKHSDGYPSGAYQTLAGAVEFFAWPLPRYEADEFAAAFVASGKSGIWNNDLDALRKYGPGGDMHDCRGGNVRLYESGEPMKVAPGDIEYRYEISPLGKTINVKCFRTHYWDDDARREECVFGGTLEAFGQWAIKDGAA